MDADDCYIDKTGLRKMVEECENEGAMICGGFRSMKKDKLYKEIKENIEKRN